MSVAEPTYELVLGVPALLSAVLLAVRFFVHWSRGMARSAISALGHGLDHVLVVVGGMSAGLLVLHELVTDRVCGGHC